MLREEGMFLDRTHTEEDYRVRYSLESTIGPDTPRANIRIPIAASSDLERI